jgi:hypothetical protein
MLTPILTAKRAARRERLYRKNGIKQLVGAGVAGLAPIKLAVRERTSGDYPSVGIKSDEGNTLRPLLADRGAQFWRHDRYH